MTDAKTLPVLRDGVTLSLPCSEIRAGDCAYCVGYPVRLTGAPKESNGTWLFEVAGALYPVTYFDQELRQTSDVIDGKTYERILGFMPRHPSEAIHQIWASENGEIMVRDERTANAIADFFEACGFDVMHTFHYDDEETDGLNLHWWAVYPDG